MTTFGHSCCFFGLIMNIIFTLKSIQLTNHRLSSIYYLKIIVTEIKELLLCLLVPNPEHRFIVRNSHPFVVPVDRRTTTRRDRQKNVLPTDFLPVVSVGSVRHVPAEKRSMESSEGDSIENQWWNLFVKPICSL